MKNMTLHPVKRNELIGMIAGAIIMIAIGVILFGCTIAPEVTEPKQASDWAKENIVGADSTGVHVRADWIRVYHGLLKAYGSKLPISEQVPADDTSGIAVMANSQIWHVSWQTNKRFTDLEDFEDVP